MVSRIRYDLPCTVPNCDRPQGHTNGMCARHCKRLLEADGVRADSPIGKTRRGRFPKLSEWQILTIRRLHAEGETQAEIAVNCLVSKTTVWRVVTGKSYKDVK